MEKEYTYQRVQNKFLLIFKQLRILLKQNYTLFRNFWQPLYAKMLCKQKYTIVKQIRKYKNTIESCFEVNMIVTLKVGTFYFIIQGIRKYARSSYNTLRSTTYCFDIVRWKNYDSLTYNTIFDATQNELTAICMTRFQILVTKRHTVKSGRTDHAI